MKQFINPLESEWKSILKRPTFSFKELEPLVENVFSDVKAKGDTALYDYTLKFDKVSLNSFRVAESDFIEAEKNISPELKLAIKLAKNNIASFS